MEGNSFSKLFKVRGSVALLGGETLLSFLYNPCLPDFLTAFALFIGHISRSASWLSSSFRASSASWSILVCCSNKNDSNSTRYSILLFA